MSLYRIPTPMEQAHAAFLLERYFGNQFPIPGKLAVPFLTTSGVERTTLRDIWNIVDPEMHGKLFQENQWWTILKLVALAQQQQQQQQQVGVDHLLFQLQSTLIPLPVFRDVQLPSTEMLMQQYYLSTVRNDFSSDALSDPLSAAFDALGPVQDAPLPSLSSSVGKEDEFAQQQQQQEDDEFGSFHSPSGSNVPFTATQDMSTGPSPGRPSLGAHALDTAQPQEDEVGEFAHLEPETCADDPVSAALNSLVPAQDAPLPKLGANSNNIMQQQHEDDDDFGDFAGVPKEPETSSDPLSAALDSLAPVQDAPLPSLGAHADICVPLQKDDNDDFGDFADAPKEHETSAGPLSAALDSLAPVQDEPLPPLGAHAVDILQSQDVIDDFGDVEDAPRERETIGAADASSAAFDSFALVQDTPLQGWGVHADDTVKQHDGNDNYGEFADEPKEKGATDTADSLSAAFDSLTPVQGTPLPVLGALVDSTLQHQDDTDDFEDFADASKAHETSVVTDPLSAALDSLAPVHDAPLPTLGAHVDKTVQQPQYDDADDFGDFADSPKESKASATAGLSFSDAPKEPESSGAADPLSAALDSLGPIPDPAHPTFGAYTDSVQKEQDNDDNFGGLTDVPTGISKSHAAYPLSSAIDSLAPVKDALLPSLGAHADDQQDDDQFGELADMPKGHVDIVELYPLSAALDSLAPVQDAPLPVLVAYTTSVPEEQGDDDDDDFGDFADAPKATLRAEHETSADPLSVALDSLAPVHDAPLPSLGLHSDVTVQQQDDDDSFGDFARAPKETSEAQRKASDPVLSALDAAAPAHNAPLPFLLSYMDATVQQPQGDSDDSGGFLDAPKEALEANDPLPSTIDPLSAAMDVLAPLQDGSLPTLKGKKHTGTFQQQYDDDGFVDFEDAPIETAPETGFDPLSSAFDVLAPVQDAPLPLLGAYSDTAHQPTQDDDDDFGDFEDAAKETADVEQQTDDPPSSALHALAPSQDAPLLSLGAHEQPQDNDEGFGGFADESKEAVAAEPEATSDPLSSALDELGAYTVTSHHQPQHSDDDLGDFDDAPNDSMATEVREEAGGKSEPVSVDVSYDFGSFADGANTLVQPELAAVVGRDNDDPLSSGCNALAPSHDSTLHSLNSAVVSDSIIHQEQAIDDSFGNFDYAPKELAGVEVIQPTESKEGSDPLPSAFDVLTPIKNAPLQPLEAFDALSLLEDAPLPPLGMQAMSTENGATGNDDDFGDFGDFEDAPEDAVPLEAETKKRRNGVRGNGEENSGKDATDLNDDFREINDASAQEGHITDTAGIEDITPSSDDDDNFGDFEDALESTRDEAAPQRIGNGEDNEKSNEDAKGAVNKDVNNDVVISCQAEASVVPAADTSEGSFAVFTTATSAPLTSFKTAPGPDFGRFTITSAPVSHVEDQTSEVDMPSNNAVPEAVAPLEVYTDDSFGDFAGFGKVDSAFPQKTFGKVDRKEPEIEDVIEDFGDFTAVEAPKESSLNTDWGDFENITHSDGNVEGAKDVVAQFVTLPTQAAQGMNEFGDVDSFHDATAEKEMTLEDMRNIIKEMQTKLRILSSTGSQMDFLKGFETHIMPKNKPSGWPLSFHKNVQKDKPKADAEQLQRGRRCCQVMTLLTSSHTKSISHWKKIINGVRDELAVGSTLLEEAKSLSGEQAVLVALATLVAGLAEYVRVVRSIVATLGDLVGEDVNVDPTRWSKDMVLLQSALQVEELWTSVQRAANGFKLVVPPLESVMEIRTKCLLHFSDKNLCQLTLQPFAPTNNGTTHSPVEWQGKIFMACAANFWSHRVSTTVPE